MQFFSEYFQISYPIGDIDNIGIVWRVGAPRRFIKFPGCIKKSIVKLEFLAKICQKYEIPQKSYCGRRFGA